MRERPAQAMPRGVCVRLQLRVRGAVGRRRFTGRERSHAMRSRHVVFGMAAALIMAIVLCVVTTAGAQKRGGTLRVAYGNEISHLDFHTAPGYELVWAVLNLGCGLVSMTADGKFVPDAADSWEISPDGLLYTFKLK